MAVVVGIGVVAKAGRAQEVVKGLHDTFYGAREFIIRDLNRFWMTFAQFASDR